VSIGEEQGEMLLGIKRVLVAKESDETQFNIRAARVVAGVIQRAVRPARPEWRDLF